MINPKISIIVPIYNAAKYLGACLDSLLDQAPFKVGEDYEIICINDGSKDNSLEILNEYGGRVKIINQENKGVSSTRNRGIEEAKGEYLWFVDSDDVVVPRFLSDIYQILMSENADWGAFNVKIVAENFTVSKEGSLNLTVTKTAPSHMENVISFIMRKSFVDSHDIKFNTTMSYGEDTLFTYFLSLYEHKSIYFENVLYFYRQVPTSAMHQKSEASKNKMLNSQLQMLKEYKTILENWDENKYLESANTRMRYYWTIQNILFTMLRCCNRTRRNNIFNQLKRDGDYPYPILWNRLVHNSPNRTIFLINAFCLLFPLEWYYRLMMKLFK